jgi:hypothetical protein
VLPKASTVNQLVVGSIPTAGAKKIKHLGDAAARCELPKHSIGTVFVLGTVPKLSQGPVEATH